jgi:hypothetical protein
MALTKAHNRMIEGAAVNVKDFGAVGDGVTDDTAAIQAAIDYLRENGGGRLVAPAQDGVENYSNEPNRYLISSTIKIDIEKVVIDCDGIFGPYGSFSGYLFEITQSRSLSDSKTSGNQFFDGSLWILPKSTSIKRLILDGRSQDLSTRQSKLIKFSRLSHSSFHDVICQYGIENSVWIDGVIESDFYNLTLRLCGKSSTLSSDAPLYIKNGNTNGWDATNNVRFYGLNIAYPAGAMIFSDSDTLINGGDGPGVNKIRNLFFYGAQLHFRDVDITGSEGSGQSNYPGASHSPAASGSVQDAIAVEFRQSEHIHFIGGNLRLGQTSNGTLIKCGDLSSTSPVTDITFTQCRFSGEGASATCLNLDFVQTSVGQGVQIIGGEIDFPGASATQVSGDSDRMVLNTFGTLGHTSFGATTDSVILSSVFGESHPRLRFLADGKFSLGSGSSAPDTTLRRNGTGLMVCDGKLGADNGLIVGNSSTSSPDVTGTTKNRKLEIFGPGGGSLGFIQVYSG